ncbi:MAG: CPP1-like family protein [Cyanobacteria bacterium P01_G01_bin.54]
MSEQNPYETLGVTQEASFEDIQNAKTRLSAQIGDDRQKVAAIEAAYDAIIMERLRMRQEGKLKVPEGIRFPERQPTPSPPSESWLAEGLQNNWLSQFIDTPDRTEVLVPTLIFGGLGVVALLATDESGQVFSLILALGFVVTLYWLTRKENRLGRSMLLTLGSLFISVVLAIGVLQLGAIPTANGGLSSTQLTTVISLLVFWVTSAFLR